MLQPVGMDVAEVDSIPTFLPRFQAMTRTFVEGSDDTCGCWLVVEVVE